MKILLRSLRLFFVASACASLGLVSCSSGSGQPADAGCAAGNEGCACYGNKTCNSHGERHPSKACVGLSCA